MKSEKMRGGDNDFNLTILCCHTFHWMCLKNWNDTTCPLCRYYQSPTESSQCEVCGISSNLWMCLICGQIGCFNLQAFQNRMRSPMNEAYIILQGHGHSFDHFNETKHTYAMEIDTHNVWDFCKVGVNTFNTLCLVKLCASSDLKPNRWKANRILGPNRPVTLYSTRIAIRSTIDAIKRNT